MVQQEERTLLLEDDDVTNESDNCIQILLLGDPGVGKTSLIYSLVNDEFDQKLPAKLADVSIPPKVTPDHVPINIADYSQRDPTQEDLSVAVRKAMVVCIVYTSGSHDSLNRVAKHWIPTVRQTQGNGSFYKPIILIANKIDLNENTNLAEKLNSIRQKFIDVEGCIEVSALNSTNIVEVFSSTRNALTYPLAPLFDHRTRLLTSKCQEALTRIFKLNDFDGDGLMNDDELNLFQENCFGTPLRPDALEDLKHVIKQSTIDGIANNSLTLEGFLFLHALSIDKGRRDFTWQVLRKYNYDNQLNPIINDSELPQEIRQDETNENSVSRLIEDTENYLTLDSRIANRGWELIDHLDVLPWVRDHSNSIKTGLGLTVTTIISFLALKYLVRDIPRT